MFESVSAVAAALYEVVWTGAGARGVREKLETEFERRVVPVVEILMRDLIFVDGWEGFQGETMSVFGTGGLRRGEDDVEEGRTGEVGREEVEAARDGVEVGVEDGLSYPDEEGEVDEDVDGGGVGEQGSDEDVEEVFAVVVLD